jgi:ABC-type maltose transport system permease subunit
LILDSINVIIKKIIHHRYAKYIQEDRRQPVSRPGIAALTFIAGRKVLRGEMMARAVMVSIPIVILFLFLQQHFVVDLTAEAVKE